MCNSAIPSVGSTDFKYIPGTIVPHWLQGSCVDLVHLDYEDNPSKNKPAIRPGTGKPFFVDDSETLQSSSTRQTSFRTQSYEFCS